MKRKINITLSIFGVLTVTAVFIFLNLSDRTVYSATVPKITGPKASVISQEAEIINRMKDYEVETDEKNLSSSGFSEADDDAKTFRYEDFHGETLKHDLSDLPNVFREFVEDFKDALEFTDYERIRKYIKDPVEIVMNEKGDVEISHNNDLIDDRFHIPMLLRSGAEYERPWLTKAPIFESLSHPWVAEGNSLYQMSFETCVKWEDEQWGVFEYSFFLNIGVVWYESGIHIVFLDIAHT